MAMLGLVKLRCGLSRRCWSWPLTRRLPSRWVQHWPTLLIRTFLQHSAWHGRTCWALTQWERVLGLQLWCCLLDSASSWFAWRLMCACALWSCAGRARESPRNERTSRTEFSQLYFIFQANPNPMSIRALGDTPLAGSPGLCRRVAHIA